MAMAAVVVAVAVAGNVGAAGNGTARLVWGFCNQEAGARLTGVWNGDGTRQAARDSCHVGIFGLGADSLDGSLFEEATICTIPTTDVFRQNSQVCSCLAAPQCGKGRACSFDCGCEVTSTDAGREIADYFDANPLLRFEGNLAFKWGDVPVKCEVALDESPRRHLWGYTMIVAANKTKRTQQCGTLAKPQFESSEWSCTLIPQYASQRMKKYDVFVQEVEFIAGAPARAGVALAAVAAALAVLLATGWQPQA